MQWGIDGRNITPLQHPFLSILQRETSEANGGIGTPDGERKAPALSIDSSVASDGSAGIDVATADAAVSSNMNAVTDFAHIATTSSGSPRSDPALRVGSFAPVGSEPVASKPVSSEPATEECFLPPNDEDTDVDESRQTTFKSNEGENYPSMNTGDENAKAHRVPSFKVNKNQDDNVKGQLGRTTSENASDIEDHLDSSIDLFESPHPLRARIAMMIGKADEKRNDTRPSSNSRVDGTRKEDTTPATTQPADITPSNCLSLSPSSDASSRNLRNAASEEEATRDDASVPLDVSTDCVDQQQQHDAEEIAQTQTQTKRPRGRPRKNPKTESQSQSQRSLRSNSNSTEGDAIETIGSSFMSLNTEICSYVPVCALSYVYRFTRAVHLYLYVGLAINCQYTLISNNRMKYFSFVHRRSN